MNLKIRNFRGIEHAEINLDGISLITGPNAAGKTSIAQALGALLTGETSPIHGMNKKDLSQLLRGGGVCEISLSDDEGKTSILYPAAQIETEGKPASASAVACGKVNIATLSTKDRSEFLGRLLNTEPTKDEVIEACLLIDISPEHAEALWSKINLEGWDGAWASIKEKGAQMKGQWLEISGEQYGSKKAESWLPENWESDLEGTSEDTLLALVTEAKEIAEAAIASEAVDDNFRARLETSAANAPMLRDKVAEAEKKHAFLGEKMVAALAKKNALPKPGVPEQTVACPSCETPLVIHGAKLALPREDASDDGSAVAAIKDVEVEISRISKTQQQLGLDQLRKDLGVVERDEEHLAKINEEAPRKSQSSEVINKTREDRQHAENRLSAFQRKTKADLRHISIGTNAEVLALIAPDGLKKKALTKALADFNAALATLASQAGWDPCIIENDLSVWFGTRPYYLCSQSEQYRAWVQLNAAVSAIDGSDVLILDSADVLNRDGRNGLFALLSNQEIPSLVCMTLVTVANGPTDREQADYLSAGLAKRKLGGAWWLDDGKAENLSA